ncbi:stress-induced protein [Streptococcus cuniculi]|uniref:Stress-induced protein n=2 Tax=Streptococcus cuniculi TaxID=1432788 RepID=A0A4Y9JAF6_9STRE|nr:KGG domain-containing protein [Streptococcus cuniculi]MBF0778170.1 stress-induced protein [Streptococcus cuniculi]TFU97912.1 stress-induced protein [Streptococcus cuniculi]
MPRGSTENLRPFNNRTESEQRKIASKGGKASGIARRKKANLKKAFETILQSDVASEKMKIQLEAMGYEATNEMALAMIMLQKAMKGDVRAFEQISKLTSLETKDSLDKKEQRQRIKALELENEKRKQGLSGDDSLDEIIIVDSWADEVQDD